jgi:excisionase family DNA binding protein
MKFEIEPQDIEAIAQKVSEIIKPLLFSNKEHNDKDVIFDVKGLADYLQVDLSWVYKQVSLKTIPYFKAGRYTRFRKREIDKWIDQQKIPSIPPLKLLKHQGRYTDN